MTRGPIATLLRGGIVTYQWTLRPLLGTQCRFTPSCSCYALQAIDAHGAMRGTWLAAGRVLRCNPWHPGGDDPVPPAGAGRPQADRIPA